MDTTLQPTAPSDRPAPAGGARGHLVEVPRVTGVTPPPPSVTGLVVPPRAVDPCAPAVVGDLYRDIHKGLRAELFAVVAAAGSLDAADRTGRAALAAQVRDVVDVLEDHAGHEDAAVQPVLERALPDLAAAIAADHAVLDRRTSALVAQAADLVDAPDVELRSRGHQLYLELSSFTGAYLLHIDVEERVVMPSLEAAVGVEAVQAVHHAIVSSIPPQDMARSLAMMVPAMNVDDRTELLGGMREGAPAEVFDGVWGLVRSVLDPADAAALSGRLGLS